MISGNITFGLELECVRLSSVATSIMQRRGFSRHYDASIRGNRGEALPHTVEEGGGSELITPICTVGVKMDNEGKQMRLDYRDPGLGNTEDCVRDLCACADEVNSSCGLHVHLGRPDSNDQSIWKPDHIRTMLAICAMREEKLFNMMPPSRLNNPHCMPIKARYTDNDLQSFYPTGRVLPRKDQNPKRYCWLNLIETRRQGNDPTPGRMASTATGTIEIRMLGSTRRFELIWSWVQLWVKIAAYVAYLPSNFAMLHCVCTDSITTELEAVKKVRPPVSVPGGPIAPEMIEHAPEGAAPRVERDPRDPTPEAPVPDQLERVLSRQHRQIRARRGPPIWVPDAAFAAVPPMEQDV